MDDQDRIVAIERELRKQAHFLDQVGKAIGAMQAIGGAQQAYDMAVMTLLETHHDRQSAAKVLEHRFAQAAAAALNESQSELFVEGLLKTQKLLRAVVAGSTGPEPC